MEKLPDVGRNGLVIFIIVGRFKKYPLIFQHFQQLIEQQRIQFTDFIDEQYAPMSPGNQARFRFRDSGICQISSGSLINRVMY